MSLKFVVILWMWVSLSAPSLANRHTPCLVVLTANSDTPQTAPAAMKGATLLSVMSWLSLYSKSGDPKGFREYLHSHVTPGSRISDQKLTELKARFAYTKWQEWQKVTVRQRDAAASLEIRKLSPAEERTAVHSLDSNTNLVQLSQQNLQRLKAQLEVLAPVPDSVLSHSKLRAALSNLTSPLQFSYLAGGTEFFKGAITHPLASPRELIRFGFAVGGFYNNLVDGSPSVSFSAIPTHRLEPVRFLTQQSPVKRVLLHPQVASENGYLLPHLNSPTDLLDFFARWEPDALQSLLHHLRYSLPQSVRTVSDLLSYLQTSENMETTFPSHRHYETFAPLRERLHRYILTEDDGAEFLRAAFERYLLWLSANDRELLKTVVSELDQPGGYQRIAQSRLHDFLGWGYFSLRVPVVVNPDEYDVFTLESLPQPLSLPKGSLLDHLRSR